MRIVGLNDSIAGTPSGEVLDAVLSREYPVGLSQLEEGRTLLVSRGVGCSTVPMRFGCPSEIHVATLA